MTSPNNGPWGPNSNNQHNQDPWGGGNDMPDLDEVLRKLKKEFSNMFPGGGKSIGVILLIIAGLWMASGFYRVLPEEQGVVLRFGEWIKTTEPGLRYHLPSPIESVIKVPVTRENRIEVGAPSSNSLKGNRSNIANEESLVLTGDENIVDVQFVIFWRIKNAKNYLFNLRNPDATVRIAAESAVREIMGQTAIDKVLTEQRAEIQNHAYNLIQEILDSYGAGIEVTQVRFLTVDAPPPSVDAFRDVQRAKSEKETLKNQAEAYRNDIVPKARGEAQKITQDAEAYREEIVNRSSGDASRFNQVLKEYRAAPKVTAKRLYLETMEEVFTNSKKIVLDKSIKNSVLPFLPLDNLKK